MFRKSPPQEETAPRVERRERNEQSFLQHGVRIDGDIHADGDLRIDGQVKGTLSVGGTLTVGPKSSIIASIKSRSMVIHGSLDGVVQAQERIHLSRGAKVRAELYCQSLVIDEGVFFHGRSHMGETTEVAPDAHQAVVRPDALTAGRHEFMAPPRREIPTNPRPDGAGAYKPEPVTGQRIDQSGTGKAEPTSPPRPDASSARPSGPMGLGVEQGRVAPDPLRRGPTVQTVTSPRTPDGPAKSSGSPLQGPLSGSGAAPAQHAQTGTEPKPSSTNSSRASGAEQAK
jgi:cytoskeletal protein CcmA (bactofilin family)